MFSFMRIPLSSIILIFSLITLKSNSQNFLYDVPSKAEFEIGLKNVKVSTNDEVKMKAAWTVAMYYGEQDNEQAKIYSNKGIELSKKLHQKYWECLFLIRKAYALKNLMDYFDAEQCLIEARKLVELNDNYEIAGADKKGNQNDKNLRPYLLSSIYLHLAFVYSVKGEDSTILKYYETAKDIAFKNKDTVGTIAVTANLSTFYRARKEDIGTSQQLAHTALYYLNDTDFIKTNPFVYKFYKSIILRNLGACYMNKDLQKANNFLNEAIHLCIGDNLKTVLLNTYFLKTDLFINTNLDSALFYSHQSLKEAQSLNSMIQINKAYNNLYKIYKQKNIPDKALMYAEFSKLLSDTLYNNLYTRLMDYKEAGYSRSDSLQKEEIYKTQLTAANQKLATQMWIVIASALVVILVSLFLNFRSTKKAKKKRDKLLLDLYPKGIIEELEKKGTVTPKKIPLVTVLFTDIKGFTSKTQEMSEHELVTELDICFSAFDDIIEKFNIEKIKTIGDAYMCAGGLMDNTFDPVKAIEAGLSMLQFMESRKNGRMKIGKTSFEMRVGIHTGEVIAGVVGKRKPAYDIWGDTVNRASRHEKNGEPGKVNISAATYELVKSKVECSVNPAGPLQVGNSDPAKMWLVEKLLTP